MTKARRSAKAAAAAWRRRKANAAHALLRVMNPAGIKRIHAVRIKKNKGGSITITPIKKAAR